MKKLIYLLVSLCIVSGLFCACNLSWKEKSDNGGDTSIKIVRFDKVVDDFVRTGNVSFSQRLSTDYPTETRILVENMLHLGSVADVHIYDELRVYFRIPIWYVFLPTCVLVLPVWRVMKNV